MADHKTPTPRKLPHTLWFLMAILVVVALISLDYMLRPATYAHLEPGLNPKMDISRLEHEAEQMLQDAIEQCNRALDLRQAIKAMGIPVEPLKATCYAGPMPVVRSSMEPITHQPINQEKPPRYK